MHHFGLIDGCMALSEGLVLLSIEQSRCLQPTRPLSVRKRQLRKPFTALVINKHGTKEQCDLEAGKVNTI